MSMTRRGLLATAAAGTAAAVAGISATAAKADETTQGAFAWNGLYDVVVVGFGGAGAVAAITAADAGAKVLLVDKAPEGHEGGNTRYCMQVIVTIDADKQAEALSYYQALRGNRLTPSDSLLQSWIAKVSENESWMQGLGANPLPKYETYPGEYPEYDTGGSIMPMVLDGNTFDSGFWRFVKQQVEQRADQIDVWYGCPATHLIRQSDDGAVIGVKVEVDGAEVNVRAASGVVLAAGGFENDLQMIQDHTELTECYAMGGQYNTGDGQRMAAEIGAGLWHMENVMGPYLGIKRPDASRPDFYSGTMVSSVFYKGGFFFVGADGTRFLNETYNPRHGYTDFHGTWIHTPAPQPIHMVFDQACLEQSFCATRPSAISQSVYLDNIEERIADGTVFRADSIEELAGLIGVPSDALTSTVETFNDACDKGFDVIAGRSAETLVALAAEGPYYAVELHPHVINTQGGPVRDEQCRILDVDGEPIPHLFGAGECGAIFSGPYQGASNIADCIAAGRIAGENAAAAKDDAPVEDGLVIEEVAPAPQQAEEYEAGENQHIAQANGICGPVTVRVTMDGDKIAQVEVLENMETDTFGGLAIAQLPAKFEGLTADEVMDVDTVTLATITSSALKLAVLDAAEQAAQA